MPRFVGDAGGINLLGWEYMICANLLGCSWTKLRRFQGAAHGAPPPTVLATALLGLPPELVQAELGKAAWKIRRPVPKPVIWRWRARLCELAAQQAEAQPVQAEGAEE